jgi:hypothetical protein
MLFWSAVLNGILAPPLVILVVLLTSDKKVMGKRANAPGAKVLGWTCAGCHERCGSGAAGSIGIVDGRKVGERCGFCADHSPPQNGAK